MSLYLTGTPAEKFPSVKPIGKDVFADTVAAGPGTEPEPARLGWRTGVGE
jgi:hypothetical protein